jgi:CubicO group peptidase (beta-lactamase class C family)
LRQFLFFLVILAGLCAPANARTATIHAFAAESWEESGAPGAAYAVIDGDANKAEGFGVTQAGGELAVSPETPFRIGSITKSFTALAIMQLAETGALTIDDTVSDHLPEMRNSPAGSITLRQLLSHTSGFSTVQGNALHDQSGELPPTLAALAASLGEQGTAYPPGTRWEYSNANYQILGAVIEAVSGSGYEDYVRNRIFAPLGLSSGTFAYTETPKGAAIGHRPWFGGHRAFDDHGDSRLNASAGGILMSARDLATYLAVMMNGQSDVLSAEGKARMLQPASEAAPFYGLGWFLDSATGSAFHGGLVPGSEALATMIPAQRKGVVVLVNTNGGIGFGESVDLREGVTAFALGREYSGSGSRWGPKTAYLSVMLLPPFFVLAIIWGWMRRREILAKRTNTAGLFSLWFPLAAMLALAFVLIAVIPQMFGGSIATILLYQPDFGAGMVAAAILAPVWALFRLVLAYLPSRPAPA